MPQTTPCRGLPSSPQVDKHYRGHEARHGKAWERPPTGGLSCQMPAESMAAADAFAANMRPIIREIQASGVQSFRGIARALTARGVKTARGGTWAVQVSDILRR
jgi:hypothetical protein